MKTSLAADFGFVRLTIVNRKTRQPTMHNTAIKFVSRAAVRSFASSALQPDFNPIEQVFAKLKTLLRKAEERTIEGVWKRIGALLQGFSPAECANYFRNSGYGST